MFANGLGDLGSVPVWVMPKTQKIVLDTALLNTQYYKLRIKGKVEQSRERSCTLPTTLVLYLMKRESSGHLWLWLPTLLYFHSYYTLIQGRVNRYYTLLYFQSTAVLIFFIFPGTTWNVLKNLSVEQL